MRDMKASAVGVLRQRAVRAAAGALALLVAASCVGARSGDDGATGEAQEHEPNRAADTSAGAGGAPGEQSRPEPTGGTSDASAGGAESEPAGAASDGGFSANGGAGGAEGKWPASVSPESIACAKRTLDECEMDESCQILDAVPVDMDAACVDYSSPTPVACLPRFVLCDGIVSFQRSPDGQCFQFGGCVPINPGWSDDCEQTLETCTDD